MGGIIAAFVSGFLIGGAARWIMPGPDPMPLWFTVVLGLAGSAIGGGIASALYGPKNVMSTSSHVFVTVMLEIGAATALLIAYRRFVQQRPLTGPDAHRFPTKGVGIARMRARLQQLGIDPEKLTQAGHGPILQPKPTTADEPSGTDELEKLRDLHEKGVLTDEEFEAARLRLEQCEE